MDYLFYFSLSVDIITLCFVALLCCNPRLTVDTIKPDSGLCWRRVRCPILMMSCTLPFAGCSQEAKDVLLDAIQHKERDGERRYTGILCVVTRGKKIHKANARRAIFWCISYTE